MKRPRFLLDPDWTGPVPPQVLAAFRSVEEEP